MINPEDPPIILTIKGNEIKDIIETVNEKMI